MRHYHIYPLSADGRICDRWDARCESDDEALAFASWMLGAGLQAEVWEKDRKLGAVYGRHQWAVARSAEPADPRQTAPPGTAGLDQP